MPLEVYLSPDRRYVTIQAVGETALQAMNDALRRAAKISRDAAVTRVFIDARRLRANLSRLELFNLASSLPASGFLPGTHFAVVIDLESPDINYFEQVAVNRGVLMDHYGNAEEALDDLLAPAFG